MRLTVLSFRVPNTGAGTVAEQDATNKVAGKGLISFEFPWGIEAKVKVNLTPKLIKLASKSVTNTADVPGLIQMLDGIYVRSYDRKAVDEQELVNYFRWKLMVDTWETFLDRVDHKRLDRWKAATKILENRWTIEMEIPWEILNYPETTEPTWMGINFQRSQARTRTSFSWSNIGYPLRYQDDGHWLHVLPPLKPINTQGLRIH